MVQFSLICCKFWLIQFFYFQKWTNYAHPLQEQYRQIVNWVLCLTGFSFTEKLLVTNEVKLVIECYLLAVSIALCGEKDTDHIFPPPQVGSTCSTFWVLFQIWMLVNELWLCGNELWWHGTFRPFTSTANTESDIHVYVFVYNVKK